MTKAIGNLALSLLLLAAAAPVAADSPSSQDCGPGLAFLGTVSAEAVLFGQAPAIPQARKGGSIGDPTEQAFCTATCGGSSSVSCWGTSCTKTDSDCDYGVRGQCWGTTTGTKYCPVCPSCIADCGGGSTVTCYGESCSAYDSHCSVGFRGYCSGTSGTKYCPICCGDPTLCEDKNNSPCSGSGSSDCTFAEGGCGFCNCDGSRWICTV